LYQEATEARESDQIIIQRNKTPESALQREFFGQFPSFEPVEIQREKRAFSTRTSASRVSFSQSSVHDLHKNYRRTSEIGMSNFFRNKSNSVLNDTDTKQTERTESSTAQESDHFDSNTTDILPVLPPPQNFIFHRDFLRLHRQHQMIFRSENVPESMHI
jgi:hypothetical protein